MSASGVNTTATRARQANTTSSGEPSALGGIEGNLASCRCRSGCLPSASSAVFAIVMDLNFTASEQAFRAEVREFLRTHLPEDISRRVLIGGQVKPDDFTRWQRILHSRGWGGTNWPKEFGGTGWTPVQQHIFDEECAAAGAPRVLPFGLKMVGPVIMAFGTPEQQRRFLPRILSAEDWWCQGYSEPG